VRSVCGIVVDMTSQKVPGPKDIKAAAQAAAETAQAVASERLNNAIDRAERYIALAEPMVRTLDAMLPQLEALVATGNDVYTAVSSIPGVSTLGRLASRATDAPTRRRPSKSRSAL
jgi:hypothetical protein